MAQAYRHFDVSAQSLSSIDIFSGLDFDGRLDVSRRCAAGRFDRRTTVLTIEDHSQDVYFVIDSFQQLFDATRPDFTPYYETLKRNPDLTPQTVLDTDILVPPNAAG